MATSVQFATPALTRSGETLFVNFADGTQLEFSGATALQDYVANAVGDPSLTRALAIGNRLARDPLLDSPEQWDGKTVTLDVEQASPSNVFRVT